MVFRHSGNLPAAQLDEVIATIEMLDIDVWVAEQANSDRGQS
jgi:hypothetical protein